ncbi:capping protein-inhibiting regulator of actin dynamics isoform X1 [Pleurodeles waltl]|uniref:capping protein-inhibiting regulator of actin dynamics isoform X1 n=1 Tax=Pleurodeles waltl TaxID=8319 RepID=UPI0037094DD1
MGTRAFSHDSIFIPDGQEENEQAAQTMSQDNIIGKVKTLQQQLVKNIRFGQPPTAAPGKRMQDKEEDKMNGGPTGDPMEVLCQMEAALSDSECKTIDSPDAVSPSRVPGAGADEEKKGTPVKPSRPKRPITGSSTIQSINLDAVPRAVARLDNSAAKHKLSVKPKNQRQSKKHKLAKDQEMESVVQKESTETHQYKERKTVNQTPEKHTVHAEIHAQSVLEEGRRMQAHQHRCAEEEKRLEEARLQLIEEEGRLTLEEQLLSEDEKRREELEVQELEAHRKHEEQQQREKEEQRQQELEAQRRIEAEWKAREEQKHLEERRRLEEQRARELEEQRCRELAEEQRLEEERKRQEEQKQKELQEHRQQEERRQRELEERKHREMEEQRRLEEERKRREEEKQKELEECRRLEEQKRRELAEQQRLEEERKRREDQKLKELEERRKLEEQMQRELEEQKRRELEEERRMEDERKRQAEEKQRQLDEQRRVEEQQQRELEEQKRRELAEEHRVEKERRRQQQLEEAKRLEEQQKNELEERKRLELEEEKKRQEQRKSEEHWKLEKQREQELEEQTCCELERQVEKRKRQEEEKQKEATGQRQHDLAELKCTETEEGQGLEKRKYEQQRRQHTEEDAQQKSDQKFVMKQVEDVRQQNQKDMLIANSDRLSSSKEPNLLHKEKEPKLKQPHHDVKEVPEQATRSPRRVNVREQERIGEELKWQEVDQRQTMPRPYTFQVSSGEKQIIFQKVNLSPVTPSKEPVHSSDTKETRKQSQSKGSHALQSSKSVPHTAILVTGAQLCGTAVNLNQIKDTACKSLLGLTDERKTVDYPPQESAPKGREQEAKPSKTKFTSESMDSQAMLAEWASIRSRILRGADNGNVSEKDQKSHNRCSEDLTGKGKGDFHNNLRKTLSASAKFSITPAWQKFSETAKTNTNVEHTSPAKQGDDAKVENKAKQSESLNKEELDTPPPAPAENIHEKDPGLLEKTHKKADNAEGCKFAKDLPSFLVPSPPQSPRKEPLQPVAPASPEGQSNSSVKHPEKAGQNGEVKASPFGIKLRRTNYSLRFHYDQQGDQKRKKRYSAGDSFDGVPAPLLKPDTERETRIAPRKQCTSPQKEYRDASTCVSNDSLSDVSGDVGVPLLPPINSHNASFGNEKQVPTSLTPQKPSLSPKPASPTPPSSPLARATRLPTSETSGQGIKKTESDAKGQTGISNAGLVLPPLLTIKNEEEETKEKKSFFPSINIPWREKAEKKSELCRKGSEALSALKCASDEELEDKPVLQSRHSLDGSRLPDKVETAQPLWITLALQKQKGFREQQATREERKQAREAKQAEKLAKENPIGVSNQSDSRSNDTSTQHKPAVLDDQKMETVITRIERREQFKKSNTLPTSVTVEIADTIPSPPLVKDISKRFSTPDATPLTTEPAWLALAKRKAKAWSDCPQIIK